MSRLTCSTCYKPIVYEIAKPIYCPYCSKPINAAFEVSINKSSVVASQSNDNIRITKTPIRKSFVKKVEFDDDEFEDDNFEIPQIGRLDVVIQSEKKQTLGGLIQNPDNCNIGIRREEKLPEIPNN